MSERHGASRRWCSQPGASALPLTIRVFGVEDAVGNRKGPRRASSRRTGAHGFLRTFGGVPRPSSVAYGLERKGHTNQAGTMPPGQRRTPPRPARRRWATCVPHMGSNEGRYRAWLAQWKEHQTATLGVTGSTPVPSRGLNTRSGRESAHQEARRWRTFVRSAAGTRGAMQLEDS
jgi:hypothetical protein